MENLYLWFGKTNFVAIDMLFATKNESSFCDISMQCCEVGLGGSPFTIISVGYENVTLSTLPGRRQRRGKSFQMQNCFLLTLNAFESPNVLNNTGILSIYFRDTNVIKPLFQL